MVRDITTWTAIVIILLAVGASLLVLVRRQAFGIVLALGLALSWLFDRVCSIWENVARDEFPYPPQSPHGSSKWEM